MLKKSLVGHALFLFGVTPYYASGFFSSSAPCNRWEIGQSQPRNSVFQLNMGASTTNNTHSSTAKTLPASKTEDTGNANNDTSNTSDSKEWSTTTKVALGIGVVALVVAAGVGIYFYQQKKPATLKKQIKSSFKKLRTRLNHSI